MFYLFSFTRSGTFGNVLSYEKWSYVNLHKSPWILLHNVMLSTAVEASYAGTLDESPCEIAMLPASVLLRQGACGQVWMVNGEWWPGLGSVCVYLDIKLYSPCYLSKLFKLSFSYKMFNYLVIICISISKLEMSTFTS